MIVCRIVTFLVALSLASSVASAELVEVLSRSQLGPNRVNLDFKGRAQCGKAENLFKNWGIKIQSDGGFSPVVDELIILGSVLTFLRNGSCEEGGAGVAESPLLIFDFAYPVTEAAFSLANGGTGVTATLKAYDSAGDLLGTLQSPEIDPSNGVFFGAKTTEGPAISKLTIEYSSAEMQEEVVDFSFSYQARPDFKSYIPQIGDAGGAIRLKTIVVVTNLTNSTAQGDIALFAQDGGGLDLDLAGNDGTAPATEENLSHFSIKPRGSAVVSTPATSDPVVQGYAVVTSSVPTETTAIFQILNPDGSPLSEAGVAGTQPETFQIATVTRAALGSVDTGIAVVNTGSTMATIDLELVNQGSESTGSISIQLGPGEHQAWFLPGLFPGAPANFSGSILMGSDVPVAATVIRTLGGLVSSSLQVAR